jgi:predicted Mrr-cat superfamily restriction endonuclease
MVDPRIAAVGSREDIRRHVAEVCDFYSTERESGAATGQIFRFVQECQPEDYVLYYDPPKKHVVFARVVSGPLFRDFDLDDSTDIFHYRMVEYAREPVPILDLYGPLKGKLLGPRMSFWEIRSHEAVDTIANGGSPATAAAEDPKIETAYRNLRNLILERAETLNEKDWEQLTVDYFRAQGAHVVGRVGGNQPIIDAEAIFYHGELGGEVWRIQVKRYQNQSVDWPTIRRDLEHVGAESRFCYVSVYGFTDEARMRADEEGIYLMEAASFTRFLLSDRYSESIRQKLRLPDLD